MCRSEFKSSDVGRPKRFCTTKCKNAYNYLARKDKKSIEFRKIALLDWTSESNYEALLSEAREILLPMLRQVKKLDHTSYDRNKLGLDIFRIARSDRYVYIWPDLPNDLCSIFRGLTHSLSVQEKMDMGIYE